MDNRFSYNSGWRDHNADLCRVPSKKRFGARATLLTLCLCVLITAYLFFFPIPWFSGEAGPEGDALSAISEPVDLVDLVSKKILTRGIKDLNLDPAHLENRFTLKKEGVPLIVESSLDPDLQAFILDLLEKSKTVRAAVVVMRPDDGRILAMVSYDSEAEGAASLCLKADYPAASLFKIVSAAAALESAGFSPEKSVSFVGRKHTLYKNQLKNRKNKYAATISFREAFASSINPVFGKLGIYDLGGDMLLASAERFFFNRTIPFDFPVGMSEIFVAEDDFGLAELASGFNKGTTISPLHAALLASAVVNDGVMMKPWIVKRVVNEEGRVLYQNSKSRLGISISPETAKELRILMKDTVLHGTCRNAFRRERRRKVYKGVELGAKTGTINDRSDEFKYDWLTAYVVPPDGREEVCIAVLGIHGKMLGIRANRLGRSIIRYYLSS